MLPPRVEVPAETGDDHAGLQERAAVRARGPYHGDLPVLKGAGEYHRHLTQERIHRRIRAVKRARDGVQALQLLDALGERLTDARDTGVIPAFHFRHDDQWVV